MTAAGAEQPSPNPEQLMWVLQIVGGDAVTEVRALRGEGSPWLVRWVGSESEEGEGRAVLRIDDAGKADAQARAETAMPIADGQGVPVPNVLGSRIDDSSSMLLTEWVDGASAQPVEPLRERLEALGALAATIFRANLGDIRLPAIDRPRPFVDFAALRSAAPHELLDQAARRLEGAPPEGPVGLVHGDLWAGNTLWHAGELVAVTDWDCAGVGAAGIDLGSLRLDAAMSYGPEATAHVLAGWEAEAAEPAESVAYWDAIAALSTAPDLGGFADSAAEALARRDLTRELMVARRDAFLSDALDRLD